MEKQRKKKEDGFEWPEEQTRRLENEAGFIAFLGIMPREDTKEDDEKREVEPDEDEKH